MKKSELRALLEFIEAFSAGRCAPYDWSFREQEAAEKLREALIKALER